MFQYPLHEGTVSQVDFISELTELGTVKKNKHIYYNVPAAFDIETTSWKVDDEKYATMYAWAFGIENWVTTGRTWQEFKLFLKMLQIILGLGEERTLIVYIHNLPYEWQFMRKLFEWEKVFLLDNRKPVYAKYQGIEFRCSLKLSSKSLARVGNDLQKYKCKKRVGDLDYSLLRHSKTQLTELEWGYIEYDIRVLLCYIQEKIESDGDITQIPLTNTGYVRNYCRKACYKQWKNYRAFISEMTVEPWEYELLKDTFQGGFTHASAKYVGKVMKRVASFDFTSSYPAVMVLEKFPMSKGELIGDITPVQLTELQTDYCVMFDLELWDVVPKLGFDHPISLSRCWGKDNVVTDNGRVVTADYIGVASTELDFDIYQQYYDWGQIKISNAVRYRKGYLPKSFVKSILDLYERKTKLKDVPGEEVNYMISKNMLNAAYGMTVTDIVREVIEYLDDDYMVTKPNLEEAIEKYNKSIKRFLFYPWGVWVTAHARHNLFEGITAAGYDYIYSDTDSIKITNPEKHMDFIESYNNRIKIKIALSAAHFSFDESMYRPKNKNGAEKVIGVWDFEGIYDRFKTLGAKRYLTQVGDKFSITVAGLGKKDGLDYLLSLKGDPFKNFEEGLYVPAGRAGKMLLTYIDTPIDISLVDYTGKTQLIHEESYIHMEPNEYHLSLSADFINYLNKIHQEVTV